MIDGDPLTSRAGDFHSRGEWSPSFGAPDLWNTYLLFAGLMQSAYSCCCCCCRQSSLSVSKCVLLQSDRFFIFLPPESSHPGGPLWPFFSSNCCYVDIAGLSSADAKRRVSAFLAQMSKQILECFKCVSNCPYK